MVISMRKGMLHGPTIAAIVLISSASLYVWVKYDSKFKVGNSNKITRELIDQNINLNKKNILQKKENNISNSDEILQLDEK